MGNSASKVKGSKSLRSAVSTEKLASASTEKLDAPSPSKRATTLGLPGASKKIIISEEDVAKHQLELETAKTDASNAEKEVQGLRQRAEEGDRKYAVLQRERDDQVSKLQGELAKELEGQLRIAESLTQERNRERKRVAELEGKVTEVETARGQEVDRVTKEKVAEVERLTNEKKEEVGRLTKEKEDAVDRLTKEKEAKITELETTHASKVTELEQMHTATAKELEDSHAAKTKEIEDIHTSKTKELEDTHSASHSKSQHEIAQLKDTLATSSKDLETARSEAASLQQKLQTLEQENQQAQSKLAAAELAASTAQSTHSSLSSELASTKEQLTTTQSTLTTLQRTHATNLSSASTASRDLATATEQHESLSAELAQVSAQLDAQFVRAEDLEMRYNESVSKKSALHEAFEALKVELREIYERFQKERGEREEERSKFMLEVARLKKEVVDAGKRGVGSEKVVNGVVTNGVNGVHKDEMVVEEGSAKKRDSGVDEKTPGLSVAEVKEEMQL